MLLLPQACRLKPVTEHTQQVTRLLVAMAIQTFGTRTDRAEHPQAARFGAGYDLFTLGQSEQGTAFVGVYFACLQTCEFRAIFAMLETLEYRCVDHWRVMLGNTQQLHFTNPKSAVADGVWVPE